jgi:hypothetical protein
MLKKLWEKYDQTIIGVACFIAGWALRGLLMGLPVIGRFFKP